MFSPLFQHLLYLPTFLCQPPLPFSLPLSCPIHLPTTIITFYQQLFRIRELAMCIICHLSNLNPAYVMPTLRKVLIQILTELEYSGIGRNKEQSAKLLGHLISNAPNLTRPYHEPILKVCLCHTCECHMCKLLDVLTSWQACKLIRLL